MERVLADTHFFIALLSERDADHQAAAQWFESIGQAQIVTSSFVLIELADGMSGALTRGICAAFLSDLKASSSIRVVEAADTLIWRGVDLYSGRPDKEWSLTDCISFVVMKDENIAGALTADRHFEQAGFTTLLARPA